MPYLYVLIPLNLIGIGLYMAARLKNDLKRVAVIQPATVILSWLIAASTLLIPEANHQLTLVVLIGMGIAIIGDFLNLDMRSSSVVMRGLVIATVAYLAYGIGLTILNGFQREDWITGGILLVAYLALMTYLWSNLGSMRIPGLIYGLVLPFTFWRALSTFFGSEFLFWQAALLSAGTFSLNIGDIEFAIHNFKKPLPIMFGPILYAGGQFLIALSTLFYS